MALNHHSFLSQVHRLSVLPPDLPGNLVHRGEASSTLWLVSRPTPQMFSQVVLRTSSWAWAQFHFSPSGFSLSTQKILKDGKVDQQSHQWGHVSCNKYLCPDLKGDGSPDACFQGKRTEASPGYGIFDRPMEQEWQELPHNLLWERRLL